jgi:hypothetical protein
MQQTSCLPSGLLPLCGGGVTSMRILTLSSFVIFVADEAIAGVARREGTIVPLVDPSNFTRVCHIYI